MDNLRIGITGMRNEIFLNQQKQLIENLKNRRLLKQYSQEYLANLVGISSSTIRRLESGQGNITLAVFLKICYHLNLLDSIIEASDPVQTPAMLHQLINQGVGKRAKKSNRNL